MKIHDKLLQSCLAHARSVFVVVLCSLASAYWHPSFGQDGTLTVSGTIVDENNLPMPGVTVMVEGTTNGTMSNPDGTFVLGRVAPGSVLLVSCIGYQNQQLKLSDKVVFNIKLVPDNEVLEEVVMVAYGQQRKVSVTGSIATVSSEELRKTTSTRLDNALAGRVTGLSSVQTSGGQPGMDGASLKIRGASRPPLILVDGVENDNIRTIDMNEVESFSILKDASATAMFGIQGADGVILIQTRRGQKGKPRLTLTYDQGWTSFTKEPERLHSWEYLEYRNLATINDGRPAPYSDALIAKFKDPYFGLDASSSDYETQKKMRDYLYCDNDYYRMLLKKYSTQQRFNANISGGSDFVKYFLNFGYIHQGGNLNTEDPEQLGYNPQSYMDRLSFRSNLDFSLAKSLTASLNIASYVENVNMPFVGNLYGGDPTADANQVWMMTDLIYQAQTILPITPGPVAIAEFGGDEGVMVYPEYLDRSAFEIINRRGFHTNKKKNLNTQLSLKWDLGELVTKGLSVRGLVSYDTYNRGILEGGHDERMYVASFDYENNTLSYADHNQLPTTLSLRNWKSNNYTVNIQGFMEYDRIFGKHEVTGLVMAMRKFWEGTAADIPYNVIGTSARLTWSYADRYLAEANLGYNGSEQFAPANRFGFFPAGSLGWVASNEGFLKDNPVLTWLKFRASYGVVGSDIANAKRFLYQDDIRPSGVPGGNTSAGGLGSLIINEGLMGNKTVQWSEGKKLNLAAEVGLFKGFRVNFDWFKERRSDQLIARQSIPSFQGVPSGNIPMANMGITDYRGYEFEISYDKTFSKDFSFQIKSNIGFYDNVRIETDEPQRTEDYVCRYRQEGYREGQPFGYEVDWNSPGRGYFVSQEEIDKYAKYSFGNPRPGDLVYKDQNLDGKVDVKDQVPIGYSTSTPGLVYGVTLGANLKGFDLNVLFSGLGRYSRFFSGQGVYETTCDGTYFGWHRNSWTQERYEKGETIEYPALALNANTNHVANDFFIMNRSFLRLKNVEIGYTLPSRFLDRAGVKSLRIYANGQNLFVWDNLKLHHLDPEQDGSIQYPITKNISVGVNVNF